MNNPTRFCLGMVLAGSLTTASPAQESQPLPPEAEESRAIALNVRAPDQLDELLGPIALYPDDLIALILPAAAAPTDIVLAARFLAEDRDPETLDSQPWDESVRALARFPDVVEWMNENLSWTQDVGDAFLTQPAEVMQSIQRLRNKAYAAGTLRDNEHHKVLVDDGVVRIVSAVPNVVYVPRYRTEVVYVDRPVVYHEPWITFGVGWTIGSWHRWSCDWYGRRVWVFSSHDHWWHHHWHRHHVDIHFNWRHFHHGHAWRGHHHHRHHARNHHYRDHRHYHHRPSQYHENERRHERWRQRDSNRGSAGRHDRDRGRDRNRDDHHDRDRDRNGSRTRYHGPNTVVTNPAPSTNVSGGAPRSVDRSNDREVHTRPLRNGSRDISAGSGDRRDHSRGSAPRQVVPANPAPTTASNDAIPAAARSNSTNNNRSRANDTVSRPRSNDTDRRDYVQRSRQQPVRTSQPAPSVQVASPARSQAHAHARDNGSRQSRPEVARPAPAPSRQYHASNNANASRNHGESSGQSYGNRSNDRGGNRSSASSSSSSNSGRSSGGRSDDGDRGGRSGGGGRGDDGGGRGGRGR